MAGSLATDPTEPRRNRVIYALGYLALGAVATRYLSHRVGGDSLPVVAALLAAILLLMATDPSLFRRFPQYRYLYFALQSTLILTLGFLPPYEDVWGVLYIFVAVQALYYLPLRAAVVWGGSCALVVTVTLALTTDSGAAYGLGLGLAYVAGSALLVSWEMMRAQAEAARRESQALLVELQRANQQLREYAAQAETLASGRERDRLARELHDSVSQTIFSITLGAESARLQLGKDPSAVPETLDRLQEMTSSALSQMRSLIAEWRPKQVM